MKVPINKDSPLAMDDFDAAVQQRMERLQSYIDLIRTAEAVEEEVKAKGTKLYLGPEDVAAYLNCSIPTARQYMHRIKLSWCRTTRWSTKTCLRCGLSSGSAQTVHGITL